MDAKEMLVKINENPELAATLKGALDRNASVDEISTILSDAGLEVEGVDELVAEVQQMRGATIAIQELDGDELDQVAGGQSIRSWKKEHGGCTRLFDDHIGDEWDDEVCAMYMFCDQFYG